MTAGARQLGAAGVEMAKKQACRRGHSRIVEIHRQLQLPPFERPAAGALEKSNLPGQQHASHQDVVMIVVDARLNAGH